MAKEILVKSITYFFQAAIVACDGRCDKAFGINTRPKLPNDDDDAERVYLGDKEVGTAPDDPGSYEGGQGKPFAAFHAGNPDRLNKWCVRECERSVMVRPGQKIVLPVFPRVLKGASSGA